MMNKSSQIPDLYHEAVRRASQPQPFVKYSAINSILLTAPNNIIFELFNTIIQEIPEENLLNFITKNLTDYLARNWNNKITQRAIKRLRREQAIDIKAGIKIIPIIGKSHVSGGVDDATKKQIHKSPESARQQQFDLSRSSQSASSPQKSPPINYKEAERQKAIKQVYEHIMWRIKTNNVTQITSLIIKQALDDGYKRGVLKAVAYNDVANCLEDWRSAKLIKLYAFGNAPANDQKLILSNTQVGDLTKWVANYIDGSEKGQKPELLAKLAGALRDKRKNCIFITNDINDAKLGIETGSIRCALVVDRLNLYEPFEIVKNISPAIEFLVTSGKIFIMSSLSCIQFAPDPTSDNCC